MTLREAGAWDGTVVDRRAGRAEVCLKIRRRRSGGDGKQGGGEGFRGFLAAVRAAAGDGGRAITTRLFRREERAGVFGGRWIFAGGG